MTDEELAAKGFTKHDGGGMPDCYDKRSLVDVVFNSPLDGNQTIELKWPMNIKIDQKWWPECITHHRRHITEREQIDMAIEQLSILTQEFAQQHPLIVKARAVRDLLKERQP